MAQRSAQPLPPQPPNPPTPQLQHQQQQQQVQQAQAQAQAQAHAHAQAHAQAQAQAQAHAQAQAQVQAQAQAQAQVQAQQQLQMQMRMQQLQQQQQQQMAAIAGMNPQMRPMMAAAGPRPIMMQMGGMNAAGIMQATPPGMPQLSAGMLPQHQLQARQFQQLQQQRIQQQQQLQMQQQQQQQQQQGPQTVPQASPLMSAQQTLQQQQQQQQQAMAQQQLMQQQFNHQQQLAQGTPLPQTPQDPTQMKHMPSPVPQSSVPNGMHAVAGANAANDPNVQGNTPQHAASPTNQTIRDRINAMQSPSGAAGSATTNNNNTNNAGLGSPSMANRARATPQQYQNLQRQEAEKQLALLRSRQATGQLTPDQQRRLQQQQASQQASQQSLGTNDEYVGSPNAGSQAGTPASMMSPVNTSGMDHMMGNPGGGGGGNVGTAGTAGNGNADELGRIQSLLTDNGELDPLEGDPLQMDDMTVESFGNVSLLSLGGGEDIHMAAPDSPVQALASLSGHGNKVSTCAFSYDGHWLVSAGMDKKIIVWSVLDKEMRHTIEGPDCHTGQIMNVRFSNDERLLVGSASQDTTVRIWDVGPLARGASSTVGCIQVLRGHKTTVMALDFCPAVGSTQCVSFDGDGELRLWDYKTGACDRFIRMSLKPGFSANPVRYHPQNPNIVAAAMGSTLYTIAIKDPAAQARPITTTHSKNISTLDWSSQGNFLVTASVDQVCVWDTTHWKVVASQTCQKTTSCAFLKSISSSPSSAGAGSQAYPHHHPHGPRNGRLIYGDYETIWIWNFLAAGYPDNAPVAVPRVHPGAAVTSLACALTDFGSGSGGASGGSNDGSGGELGLVLASTSAGKEGNLKLWKASAALAVGV
ncbi:hypothetical protein BGZ73_003704 [Actinomortierella ambigua]|nr:hypothetical protein BGZ73_003704 [Actinomortierella ambigua]